MIEVQDLRMRHGELEILRGIDVSVARGEVAVIIGPSGGGKSTLLRCLNGLERFESGLIVVDDIQINGDTNDRDRGMAFARIRRKVGMVFQGFHLFPHRTVLENVTEAPIHVLGLPRDVAETRALALLDRVGMASFGNRRPSTLSGGQQQRVAIARALAMEPNAILFDEPTSALDPISTGEVLAVMADLAAGGESMVVVTHAMEFARRAAKTVHVIVAGLVVESGPPDQVFDAPRNAATRAFLCRSMAG